MPDYDETKAINVKSNLNTRNKWTAPANGYVIPLATGIINQTTDMYINGVLVTQVRSYIVTNNVSNWADEDNPGPIPVSKGDVIKFDTPSALTSAKFYPCK